MWADDNLSDVSKPAGGLRQEYSAHPCLLCVHAYVIEAQAWPGRGDTLCAFVPVSSA